MADTPRLLQKGETGVLPVEGREVSQIRIDFNFEVILEQLRIRIGGPFDVSRSGDAFRIDPENTSDLGRLLHLHKVRAKSGVAQNDGLLSLVFEDRTSITVPPHEAFEAWEATTDLPLEDRFILVALPGGGLAVWSD